MSKHSSEDTRLENRKKKGDEETEDEGRNTDLQLWNSEFSKNDANWG